MFKVASQSKSERASIQDSEIAREGKSLMIQIQSLSHSIAKGRPKCLLCGNMAAWLEKTWGPAIPYVDTITISIGKICLSKMESCSNPLHPNLGLEVSLLIEKLPTRFDAMKVSYIFTHACDSSGERKDINPRVDSLVKRLREVRPTFIFDYFRFSALQEMKNEAQFQEYLFSHVRSLTMHSRQSRSNITSFFLTPATCNAKNRPLQKIHLYLAEFEIIDKLGLHEKIVLPSQINPCWTTALIPHLDFSQVTTLSESSMTDLGLIQKIKELVEHAPNFRKLFIFSLHEDWLEQISSSLESASCLDEICLSANEATLAKILGSNLTLHTKRLTYRTLRGALFDKPKEGQPGGVQSLSTINENYELISHSFTDR